MEEHVCIPTYVVVVQDGQDSHVIKVGYVCSDLVLFTPCCYHVTRNCCMEKYYILYATFLHTRSKQVKLGEMAPVDL